MGQKFREQLVQSDKELQLNSTRFNLSETLTFTRWRAKMPRFYRGIWSFKQMILDLAKTVIRPTPYTSFRNTTLLRCPRPLSPVTESSPKISQL